MISKPGTLHRMKALEKGCGNNSFTVLAQIQRKTNERPSLPSFVTITQNTTSQACNQLGTQGVRVSRGGQILLIMSNTFFHGSFAQHAPH